MGRSWLGAPTTLGNPLSACPTPTSSLLAAGWHHSLGLKADGSIVAWGYNGYGQTNVPAPNSDFVAIAAGGPQSGSEGRRLHRGVGIQLHGQTNVPAPNSGFHRHRRGPVSQSGSQGRRVHRGVGEITATVKPTFPANTDFVAVAAGSSTAWASRPTARSWPGDATATGKPTSPRPTADFVAVAAGWYHSLGLKADGSIVAWGDNHSRPNQRPPRPTAGFVAIAAGSASSLGLKADGSIVAWGYNGYGQTNVPVPKQRFHRRRRGGYPQPGPQGRRLHRGVGRERLRSTNVPAPNSGFRGHRGGAYPQSRSEGRRVHRGVGIQQLRSNQRPRPTRTSSPSPRAYHHSLGLKADGSIVAWGDNATVKPTFPAPNTGFIAVAAGWPTVWVSRPTARSWRGESTPFGQTNVPAPNSGFRGRRRGRGHSLGLKADGSIVAWGNNYHGQTNVPAPIRISSPWLRAIAQLGPEDRRLDRGVGSRLSRTVEHSRANSGLRRGCVERK